MLISQNLKTKVTHFLQKHPSLRDNDRRLIANVWGAEGITGNMRVEHFFERFITDDLSSPESIRRCRQKVQEEHKELRGEAYAKRHKKAEEVMEEILFKGEF
tara:strand:+ start:843 stop:1148 length:306 start_codon:yes stop_codon:yes gene_type:complete